MWHFVTQDLQDPNDCTQCNSLKEQTVHLLETDDTSVSRKKKKSCHPLSPLPTTPGLGRAGLLPGIFRVHYLLPRSTRRSYRRRRTLDCGLTRSTRRIHLYSTSETVASHGQQGDCLSGQNFIERSQKYGQPGDRIYERFYLHTLWIIFTPLCYHTNFCMLTQVFYLCEK
jgi:hypothetical protein